MKEELIEKLNDSGIEAITSVLEFMKSGTNFVAEQAPLYVQELLQWGFYDNLTGAIISSICAFIGCILCIFLFRKMIKEDDAAYIPVILVPLVIMICSFCTLVSCTKTCIKIKVAPRVYIIESLTNKVTK